MIHEIYMIHKNGFPTILRWNFQFLGLLNCNNDFFLRSSLSYSEFIITTLKFRFLTCHSWTLSTDLSSPQFYSPRSPIFDFFSTSYSLTLPISHSPIRSLFLHPSLSSLFSWSNIIITFSQTPSMSMSNFLFPWSKKKKKISSSYPYFTT